MTRTFFVAHVPPPRVLVHARLQVSAAVLARQTQPNCGVCVSGVKTYLNYTHTAGIQLCFRLDRLNGALEEVKGIVVCAQLLVTS
ncbi:hypothetical protein F2P79_006367 [Pimephales promelas]|nr:hypothetical protein F2P79_006367 [Pimephales promelas]